MEYNAAAALCSSVRKEIEKSIMELIEKSDDTNMVTVTPQVRRLSTPAGRPRLRRRT
jgi:hypothetical protein